MRAVHVLIWLPRRGGVVGIHGTNEPQMLPGRVSHGCIRLPNEDVEHLAKLLLDRNSATIV